MSYPNRSLTFSDDLPHTSQTLVEAIARPYKISWQVSTHYKIKDMETGVKHGSEKPLGLQT